MRCAVHGLAYEQREHGPEPGPGGLQLRLGLPGLGQVDVQRVGVRLVGQSAGHAGFNPPAVAGQLVLQQAVLPQLRVDEQQAEEHPVHPCVHRVEAHVGLPPVGLCLCAHRLSPRADVAPVPYRLAQVYGGLVLVAAHGGYLYAVHAYAAQVDGYVGHVALHRRLGRQGQLRQVALGCACQVDALGLVYQRVSFYERVVGPCLFVALLNGQLGAAGEACGECQGYAEWSCRHGCWVVSRF